MSIKNNVMNRGRFIIFFKFTTISLYAYFETRFYIHTEESRKGIGVGVERGKLQEKRAGKKLIGSNDRAF